MGRLAPDQVIKSFRLEPGLRIELVAAEPLIESPVAMAFDERAACTSPRTGAIPPVPAKGTAGGTNRPARRHRRRRALRQADRLRNRADVSQRRDALEGRA